MAEAPESAAAAQKTSGGNTAYHNFHNDFLHVEDPNERRRLALAEIDKAPFGWYHVRAIVVAGVGFFTDSYDIFAVSLLTTMLGIVYYSGSGYKGIMPTSSDSAIKLSTSAGTVIGQLTFGALADIVGSGPQPCSKHSLTQLLGRAQAHVRSGADHHHLRNSGAGAHQQLALDGLGRRNYLLACHHGTTVPSARTN